MQERLQAALSEELEAQGAQVTSMISLRLLVTSLHPMLLMLQQFSSRFLTHLSRDRHASLIAKAEEEQLAGNTARPALRACGCSSLNNLHSRTNGMSAASHHLADATQMSQADGFALASLQWHTATFAHRNIFHSLVLE